MSFTRVVPLTTSKAIVVVCSFDPGVDSEAQRVAQAALTIGTLASLLVALLVYHRQLLVVEYKGAMEKARSHSLLKTRFVADMSHEIRTPLTGIIGMAELLSERTLTKSC